MVQYRSSGKGKDRKVYPVSPGRKGHSGRTIDISNRATADISGLPSVDIPTIRKMREISKQFNMEDNPGIPLNSDGDMIGVSRLNGGMVRAYMKLDVPLTDTEISKFNAGKWVPDIKNHTYSPSTTVTIDMSVQDRNAIKALILAVIRHLNAEEVMPHTYINRKKVHAYDLQLSFFKKDNGEEGYVTVMPEIPYNLTKDLKEVHGYSTKINMRGPAGSSVMVGVQSFLDGLKIYDTINDVPKGAKTRGERYFASFSPDEDMIISTSKISGKRIVDLPSCVSIQPNVMGEDDMKEINTSIKSMPNDKKAWERRGKL